ncbi:hypothetical protein AGMMS49953_04970 [Endomicrobiia bacterium]|nr:hypothetical protein AGMMS49953_04970 [Endomicrobiia bacterium]
MLLKKHHNNKKLATADEKVNIASKEYDKNYSEFERIQNMEKMLKLKYELASAKGISYDKLKQTR